MPEAAPLSPAEATFLLKPNSTPGYATIKVTLVLMLTKGVLRIEETEEFGVFRNKKIAHLRVAAEPKDAPPEIAALIEVVGAAQGAGGKMRDVIKSIDKAFGPGGHEFNNKFIVPSLIARGLLTEKKVWLVRTRHVTAAGEREADRIRSDMFKAKDVARLLKSDPAQAAALAASIGSVLLSDALKKQLKPLSDAMRAPTDPGSMTFGSDGGGIFSGGFDFGSFDLGSFDTGAFDSIDAGMASFDSGFSDAGGDGSSGGD